MDIAKLIQELREERNKLDQAIRALESVRHDVSRPVPAGRRGRKYMSPDERLAVSERMRRYWADRKGKLPGRKPTPIS